MNFYEQGKPVSLAIISDFEDRSGYRLPADFKDLIKDHDGGRVELDSVPIVDPESGETVDVGFDQFIAFVKDGTDVSMYEINFSSTNPPPVGFIAFGINGGGDVFAFDYSRSGSPAVVFLSSDWPDHPVIPVADGFTAFIDLLREDPTAVEERRLGL